VLEGKDERPKKPPAQKKEEKKEKSRKLTFKEGKELDSLPGLIEDLEKEQKEIYANMSDPEFYKGSADNIPKAQARLDEIEKELKSAYARWEELEELKEVAGNQ